MPVTIADILDFEVDRLNNRKVAIDNAEEERKRIVRFNKSGTERKQAYNNLYLVIVILLGILLGIKLLYQVDFIPDTILDILMVAVVSVGLIYCLWMYTDILRRSNMDFSQIEFDREVPKSQAQKDKEELDRVKSGDLIAIGSVDKCVGPACCPTDSTYNPTFKICVPNMVPHGVVPIKGSDTELQYGTNAKFTVTASGQRTTVQIVDDLAEPKNYKYCRSTDGTYAWLPITSSNKILNTNKNGLTDVVATDPNFLDTDTRTAYVPETMSTNPVKTEAFTSDIQPFSKKTRFASYV